MMMMIKTDSMVSGQALQQGKYPIIPLPATMAQQCLRGKKAQKGFAADHRFVGEEKRLEATWHPKAPLFPLFQNQLSFLLPQGFHFLHFRLPGRMKTAAA